MFNEQKPELSCISRRSKLRLYLCTTRGQVSITGIRTVIDVPCTEAKKRTRERVNGPGVSMGREEPQRNVMGRRPDVR